MALKKVLIHTVFGPAFRYVSTGRLPKYEKVGTRKGRAVMAKRREVRRRRPTPEEIEALAREEDLISAEAAARDAEAFEREHAAGTADVIVSEDTQNVAQSAAAESAAIERRRAGTKVIATTREEIAREDEQLRQARQIEQARARQAMAPEAQAREICKIICKPIDTILVIDTQGRGSVPVIDEEGNPAMARTVLISSEEERGLYTEAKEKSTGRTITGVSRGQTTTVYRRTKGIILSEKLAEGISYEEAMRSPEYQLVLEIQMENGDTAYGFAKTERTEVGVSFEERFTQAKDRLARVVNRKTGRGSNDPYGAAYVERMIAEGKYKFGPRKLIY